MLQRILSWFSIALLVVAGSAILLFSWSATGWKIFDVPTGSMRPVIPTGSLVVMHRVPISSLKVGDVITYANPLSPRKTISHRIIRIYQIGGKVPGFITKGDANKSPDMPIPAGAVFGKVVWHIPAVGSWLTSSKSWVGISLLVYFPALLIMIEEVQRLAAYLKSLQPYKLPGFRRTEKISQTPALMATGLALCLTFIITGSFVWEPALALLKSNTVALANNQISAAAKPGGMVKCSNTNKVMVTNSSSQSASTGSATSSAGATGGTATSGNASNSSSTNTTISIQNC